MKTIFDVEVAPNRAMVGFMDIKTGKVKQFEHNDSNKIADYVSRRTIIGFNSLNYDNIIITAMMRGKTADEIYAISKDLIEGGGKRWDYPSLITNHIDLMEVAPGQAGLKLYAAVLGTKKLQDLPYSPHAQHTKKMWKNVCEYNVNDLHLTLELYNELLPRLDLRKKISKKYGVDVMSKSDPQIAESIFQVELAKNNIDAKARAKKKLKVTTIKYKAPDSIVFQSKHLNELVKRIERTTIEVNGAGSPVIPKWLKDHIVTIGGSAYNIQMGGLHSMEKSMAVVGKLGNVDVASMYPSMIIELGLFPPHLTAKFLDIYTSIRDTRMEAKRAGDMVVSDVLKIVLNGSYGKFGSLYSFLYSPDMMLQVTFTGQLYLLMLIEAFEDNNVTVVSSNTDGIEYIDSNPTVVKNLVDRWEKATNLEMEYGSYTGLYARDVNAYIATYPDYAKRKGFYDTPGLKVSGIKGWEYPIVTEAITQFLQNGKSMKKTIKACKDPAQFCVARQVNGGALWSDVDYPDTEEYIEYLKKVPFKQNKALEKRNDNYKKEFVLLDAEKNYIGKVVRYYYSKKGYPMFTKSSGNRVPKSDGCRPMMELVDKLPKDLDIKKYIALANTHLEELGFEK